LREIKQLPFGNKVCKKVFASLVFRLLNDKFKGAFCHLKTKIPLYSIAFFPKLVYLCRKSGSLS